MLVNVQARELGLGSGGFDVLHVNLTRGLDLAAEAGAHVMKLPVHAAAARGPPRRGGRRARGVARGMPVVCCSLHSQLAPVCARARRRRSRRVSPAPGRRAARLALGRRARAEGARARSRPRSPSGACFDGDVELRLDVRPRSRGRRRAGYDVAVCAIGPGHRRDRHAPRPRRARGGGGGQRRGGARRPSRCSPRASRRPTSASATAASRTTRGPCSRLRLGEVDACADRREVDADGLARGLRGPAALAHGPRPGRGSRVLRGRVRRRPARARARSR